MDLVAAHHVMLIKNKADTISMRTNFGLFIFLILMSIFSLILVKEAFGATQGGVFVQLASTHVPTAEDEEAARRYPYQVNREIANMTGSPLF